MCWDRLMSGLPLYSQSPAEGLSHSRYGRKIKCEKVIKTGKKCSRIKKQLKIPSQTSRSLGSIRFQILGLMRRRRGAERATQGSIPGAWEKCIPAGRNQLGQERMIFISKEGPRLSVEKSWRCCELLLVKSSVLGYWPENSIPISCDF